MLGASWFGHRLPEEPGVGGTRVGANRPAAAWFEHRSPEEPAIGGTCGRESISATRLCARAFFGIHSRPVRSRSLKWQDSNREFAAFSQLEIQNLRTRSFGRQHVPMTSRIGRCEPAMAAHSNLMGSFDQRVPNLAASSLYRGGDNRKSPFFGRIYHPQHVSKPVHLRGLELEPVKHRMIAERCAKEI